jgi:peptide/nickel transport system substrate-binding protein
MRRLLRRRSLAGLAVAATICGGLAACSSSPSAGQKSSGATPTLVMESSPETSITQAFNPFVATQAAYGMGATGLIYEPLIEFNLAAPPQYYPWLATHFAWGNGGKQITFTIRSGVKWSNGKPLTPADVAFTFNMMKKNTAVNLGGLDISSVSTSGNQVTVNFPAPQYTKLQQIAGIAVVPEAIWSKVKNPATFTDPNPVGSGPFVLDSFTPQGFTLKRNPNYWQAPKLHVNKVYFPVYTSNTGALSALFSGQIDWTGNFIPGLKKNFVDTNPKYHHYWEAPGGTNSLMPNLNKWPTNQLAVRKAISLAIDRTLIATDGEAGLENSVLNATGLTLPLARVSNDHAPRQGVLPGGEGFRGPPGPMT